MREKMVEAAASEFIVIVDESKLVDGLGGSKLAMPVEIVQVKEEKEEKEEKEDVCVSLVPLRERDEARRMVEKLKNEIEYLNMR